MFHMNWKDTRTRRKAIAFGAVATVVAGGVSLAQQASAVGTLTASPSATSITVPNLGASATGTGPYNLLQPLSDATFATRITSTLTTNLKLVVDGYTAPTGVTAPANEYVFYAERVAGGTAGPTSDVTNATSGPWTRLDVTNSSTTAVVSSALTGSSSVATRDVFLAFSAPGTYTYHFVDAGPSVGTDDDLVSPTVTVTVKDVAATTASTADDWTPSVTATSSTVIGLPITTTVDMSSLTLTDTRGSSSGAGTLGSKLAALVGVQYSTTNASNTAATTFGTTSTTRTLAGGSVTAAGTTNSTARFDLTGDGVGNADPSIGTSTTTVASNNVSALSAVAVTGVTGSVKAAAGTATIKPGTASATYTTTVTDGDTDKSGNIVYFTLDPAVNSVVLTGTGTLISTTTGTKVYSVATDSSGVASITVTSDTTTNGTAYTVDAATNGQSASQLTATYTTAAAATFEVTNSSGELVPTVGTTSVTLKGKLLDQYGAAFQPAVSSPQQATVTVDVSPSTCGTYAAADATLYGTISGGEFSAAYTPATAGAAGQCDVFRFAYSGATNLDTSLTWSSATPVNSLTMSAPADGATAQTLQVYDSVTNGTAVTGTTLDSNGATLAYKSVTLTGSTGVYFSSVAAPTTSSSDDLKTSLTVASNNSGTYSAYVFFTKAGTATITATSGGKTKTNTVTVSDAANAKKYKVIAIDASGSSGSVIVVTGKAEDIFGNPVPSATVDLSIGTSTLGVLATSSGSVTANSAGVWSTTFTTGSNQSGTATLTATLNGQSANRTPATAWLANAGLTLPGGSYQDTATITVGSAAPTLTGPAKATGSTVTLSGTAPGGAQVDIYAKKAGSADAFAWVGSATADGTTGDWSKAVTIAANTTYVAKVGSASSSELTVTVSAKSSVVASAKAMGKRVVKISVAGTPKTKGTIVVYIKSGSKWVKVRTWASTASGAGSINVKTSAGAKTFLVYFTPSGGTRASAQVKVTVK